MIIALLIAAFAGIIVLGYVFLGRLDRFLNKGGFLPEDRTESGLSKRDILLYGEEKEVDELCQALTAAGFTHIISGETEDKVHYHWACAISHDDADNLLFCVEEKRKEPGVLTMAVCSQAMYRDLFLQKGIDTVLSCADASRIIEMMKGTINDETSR